MPRNVQESLHPYVNKCDYKGEVQCDGAKAMRVTFDPKWYVLVSVASCGRWVEPYAS